MSVELVTKPQRRRGSIGKWAFRRMHYTGMAGISGDRKGSELGTDAASRMSGSVCCAITVVFRARSRMFGVWRAAGCWQAHVAPNANAGVL